MRAIVVGGGIAGPVLASALHRVGVGATVYEAYDAPADGVGYFLNLASNGLDALGAIGIDVARLEGHRIPRLVFWNGRGRRLGEVANGITRADGTASICVNRGHLQRVLQENAAGRGVGIEYGKRLRTVQAREDGVRAEFADGSVVTGDLLVGADGIHSRVRAVLDPTAPRPAYTGLVSVGGYSENIGLPTTVDTQHFVFGRRAFFGYLVHRNGDVWWFANIGLADAAAAADVGAVDTEQWRVRLLDLFADDRPLIREIIGATVGRIGAYPIYDLATTQVWHRDRVALVGDALHAMSPSAGQGASMAVEDAVELARCVRDAPTPMAGFASFEALRRGRVERMVAYARKRGSNKAASSALARTVRDLVLPIVFRAFANERAHAWIYQHHIDFDAATVPHRAA
jgi:FAD-dependent urate hydroxylase